MGGPCEKLVILRMAELMSFTYGGTSIDKVRRDLAEKQFILLLYGEDGAIEGFSTIQLFDSVFRGRPVKIVYSGDTVIQEESRGQTVLMHDWWQFTCTVQRQFRGMDVYWMLIEHRLSWHAPLRGDEAAEPHHRDGLVDVRLPARHPEARADERG